MINFDLLTFQYPRNGPHETPSSSSASTESVFLPVQLQSKFEQEHKGM